MQQTGYPLGQPIEWVVDLASSEILIFQLSCFLISVVRTKSSPPMENRTLLAECHLSLENTLSVPIGLAPPDDCPNTFECERFALSFVVLLEFVVDVHGKATKFSWECPIVFY